MVGSRNNVDAGKRQKIVSLRRLLPYVAGVLWLFFIIPDATAVGTEVQPPERREPDRTMATSKDKVFLEAANELEFNELITPDFQIVAFSITQFF